MKFSIININTLFAVILILTSSSVLSYISIFGEILFGDLIWIGKFFLMVIVLINIFSLGFIIYKLRLIAVTNREIFIIYPLRFSIKKSKREEIKDIKWNKYIDARAIYYRQLSFKTEDGKSISICDKEFENLDAIAKSMGLNIKDNKKIEKLNIERAEANKFNQLINVLFAIFLTCSLIYISVKMETWNYKKIIFIGITSILMILLLVSNVGKYLMYKKTPTNKFFASGS